MFEPLDDDWDISADQSAQGSTRRNTKVPSLARKSRSGEDEQFARDDSEDLDEP